MLSVLDSCHHLKSETDFEMEQRQIEDEEERRGKKIVFEFEKKKKGEEKLGGVWRD